jgi:hypothetical protein
LHADEEISDSRPSSRLQRRGRRVIVVVGGGGGGPVAFSISISIVAISQKGERAGRAMQAVIRIRIKYPGSWWGGI